MSNTDTFKTTDTTPMINLAKLIQTIAHRAEYLWADMHQKRKPWDYPTMDHCITFTLTDVPHLDPDLSDLIHLMLTGSWENSLTWADNVTKTQDRG